MTAERGTLERVVALWEKMKPAVTEHLQTLAHRRLALITTDVYGVTNSTKWDDEIDYFVKNVVLKRLAAGDISEVEDLCFDVADAVKSCVPELSTDHLKGTFVTPQTTPEEFEHWCKCILLSNGWTARTTQRSGDQGADVIAEKFGIRLIIQCKLYNYSVGNKAVQEAYAAKAHYQAAIAAVVTNSSFTTSAQALANTTGVLLLHHSQINSLEDLFGDS
jgi:restriction system protein